MVKVFSMFRRLKFKYYLDPIALEARQSKRTKYQEWIEHKYFHFFFSFRKIIEVRKNFKIKTVKIQYQSNRHTMPGLHKTYTASNINYWCRKRKLQSYGTGKGKRRIIRKRRHGKRFTQCWRTTCQIRNWNNWLKLTQRLFAKTIWIFRSYV